MADKINAMVFLLVMLYGMGSWVAINGIWAELSLLVSILPESWGLPSLLVLIIQFANIGPLLFATLRQYKPAFASLRYGSYAIIAIGFVSCVLLSIFWDHISEIGGKKHSILFLFFSFCLALVDCTSSVVFLPYMAKFPASYMIAFYIGEGLSGVVPSLLGLVQGTGGDTCYNASSTAKPSGPVFSVNLYFGILSFVMVICGSAFFALNTIRLKRTDWYADLEPATDSSVQFQESKEKSVDPAAALGAEISVKSLFTNRAHFKFLQMFTIIGIVSALGNGVIPAIQSYACLPYGPTAYHLSIELALLANPLICFTAFYVTCTNPHILTALCTVSVAAASVIIHTATTSPSPWLAGEAGGVAYIIILCIAWTTSISYIKVCVASALREYGERLLLWCGVVTQLGSCVGAVTIFIITSQTKTFVSC